MCGDRLAAALADHALWGMPDAGSVRTLKQLKGGLTNQSYLLNLADNYYVLRLFASNSEQLAINRDAEFGIAQLAASQGLAAQPIYLSADKSYSLNKFIEGDLPSQTTLSSAEQLQQLAKVLSQLHAIKVNIELPVLDVAEKAENYWRAIAQVEHAQSLLVYKPRLQGYFSNLSSVSRLSLCHNDLVAENMLFGRQGLKLIDWEYAALGCPAFDLATVLLNKQLTKQQEQHFLACYEGGVDKLRLAQAKAQVLYLEWLWWGIQKQVFDSELQQKLDILLTSID